jgi:hypothetical protein
MTAPLHRRQSRLPSAVGRHADHLVQPVVLAAPTLERGEELGARTVPVVGCALRCAGLDRVRSHVIGTANYQSCPVLTGLAE